MSELLECPICGATEPMCANCGNEWKSLPRQADLDAARELVRELEEECKVIERNGQLARMLHAAEAEEKRLIEEAGRLRERNCNMMEQIGHRLAALESRSEDAKRKVPRYYPVGGDA